MLLSILAPFALLPYLALAHAQPESEMEQPEVIGVMGNLEWRNPYVRQQPGLDRRAMEAGVFRRDNAGQGGTSPFNIYMCRDAAMNSCDKVWVSSSQYCYDNEHWFGWKGPGIPIAVRVEGPTCCAFYADKLCNKVGGNFGWINKVCESENGGSTTLTGSIGSYMCNVPYGSANIAMDTAPAAISALPSNAAINQPAPLNPIQ